MFLSFYPSLSRKTNKHSQKVNTFHFPLLWAFFSFICICPISVMLSVSKLPTILKSTLQSNENTVISNSLLIYIMWGTGSRWIHLLTFSLVWITSDIADIPTPINLYAGADSAHWSGSAPLVIQLVLISFMDKARQIESRPHPKAKST